MRYICVLVLLLVHLNGGEESQLRKLPLPEEIESTQNDLKSSDEVCPDTNVWFVQGKNGSCHCGSDLDGVVQCDSETKEVAVLDCYCLTNDYTKNVPVVGSCLFNCGNVSKVGSDQIYQAAPSNCNDWNREGTLCGRCLDGYALPAYSYTLKCIRCDSELQNWWLYITYAFLPLTVFIGIILVLRINVASPKLFMFVIAAHAVHYHSYASQTCFNSYRRPCNAWLHKNWCIFPYECVWHLES